MSKAASANHIADRSVKPDEAKAMLAAIPPDTRDFMARLAGDPLPGRSALDKREGQF